MPAPPYALLALSDGSFFFGKSKGYFENEASTTGEVVFNTAITGYQEVLTDPSYHRQIINFTHPHIGNTGVNLNDHEAARVFAAGIIACRISEHFSNWRAKCSLPAFLQEKKIIAIDGVDTRAITRLLRDKGALGGCIMLLDGGADDADKRRQAKERALNKARQFAGLSGSMLARDASGNLPTNWEEGIWQANGDTYAPLGKVKRHVVVIDCGAKKNILRSLVARGCRVSVLPYDAGVDDVRAAKPDGVLLSNGPGDPAPCENAQALAKAMLDDKTPLFGLCLGHQIVAQALGMKTEKMKFGHHGANHPVKTKDGRVLITSQNHGFAVSADSVPHGVEITHTSLFDGSLQGLCGNAPPFISFQGHPEASPGPHDAAELFNDFVKLMDDAKA